MGWMLCKGTNIVGWIVPFWQNTYSNRSGAVLWWSFLFGCRKHKVILMDAVIIWSIKLSFVDQLESWRVFLSMPIIWALWSKILIVFYFVMGFPLSKWSCWRRSLQYCQAQYGEINFCSYRTQFLVSDEDSENFKLTDL